MKTTKITLITAMIALGAILYGQTKEVQFINTNYAVKSSRFENLVYNFQNLTERTERVGYMEPVVYMSYTVKQADVVYEENYGIEAWMTSPFKSSMAETDLDMEAWMVAPFENRYADADLSIEKWMTTPFVDADHIKIESWMTAAF